MLHVLLVLNVKRGKLSTVFTLSRLYCRHIRFESFKRSYSTSIVFLFPKAPLGILQNNFACVHIHLSDSKVNLDTNEFLCWFENCVVWLVYLRGNKRCTLSTSELVWSLKRLTYTNYYKPGMWLLFLFLPQYLCHLKQVIPEQDLFMCGFEGKLQCSPKIGKYIQSSKVFFYSMIPLKNHFGFPKETLIEELIFYYKEPFLQLQFHRYLRYSKQPWNQRSILQKPIILWSHIEMHVTIKCKQHTAPPLLIWLHWHRWE